MKTTDKGEAGKYVCESTQAVMFLCFQTCEGKHQANSCPVGLLRQHRKYTRGGGLTVEDKQG